MTEAEVVAALVAAYPREVECFTTQRLCVMAARIGSEALGYFGIGCRVVPVEMMVFNDLAAEAIVGRLPFSEWPEDAWSIGVTRDTPGPGYAGHLLIETEEGRILDLSARQFDRPGRMDVRGPRVWTSADLRTTIHPGELMAHEPGLTWLWTPFVDASYRRAPDWRRGSEIAGPVIRAMRACL